MFSILSIRFCQKCVKIRSLDIYFFNCLSIQNSLHEERKMNLSSKRRCNYSTTSALKKHRAIFCRLSSCFLLFFLPNQATKSCLMFLQCGHNFNCVENITRNVSYKNTISFYIFSPLVLYTAQNISRTKVSFYKTMHNSYA